ncbi:MAG: hypothetical protein ACI4JD_05750 [Ruminococcus sp.]
MKKIIGLILCLSFVMTAAGCGDKEDVRGTVETSVTEAAETAEVQNDDDSAAEAAEEEDFSFGSVNSNVYENKFIGIGCKLDNNWTFYDDEQIKQLNNITMDAIDEDVAEMINNADIIYDMYASYSDEMTNININLENIGVLQYASFDVAENFEKNKSILSDTYENMGYSVESMEPVKIEIDGKEFDGMCVKASIDSLVMYQTLFGIKCGGKYLASVTVTSFNDDITQDIVDTFYLTD